MDAHESTPVCPWTLDIYTTPCPVHGGMLADCPAPVVTIVTVDTKPEIRPD